MYLIISPKQVEVKRMPNKMDYMDADKGTIIILNTNDILIQYIKGFWSTVSFGTIIRVEE